jgi:Mg-chelatase subunit ChlD
MKICSNCAASNVDAAEVCSECGAVLVSTPQRIPGVQDLATRPPGVHGDDDSDQTARAAPAQAGKVVMGRPKRTQAGDSAAQRSGSSGALDADYLARTITSHLESLSAFEKRHRADIMFILDCTQSMRGELEAIKDAIFSFVDTIRTDGVRVRIGLIEFRDRLIDEEARVLMFDGEPFTADPEAFRREAQGLRATGGGDEPESSLDAVMLALAQPFSARAHKILVLITDAPPHVPDKEARTIEEVAEAVRAAQVSQFYLVIRVTEPKNMVYLRLCEGTRSVAFDLGKGDDFRRRAEHFKRTLMSLGKTISTATK